MLHKFISLGTSATLLRTSLGNFIRLRLSGHPLHAFRWNLVPYAKMLLKHGEGVKYLTRMLRTACSD